MHCGYTYTFMFGNQTNHHGDNVFLLAVYFVLIFPLGNDFHNRSMINCTH